MTDKIGNRKHGAVFTPKEIARKMAYLIPEDKLHSVLDPACGSGNLLVAVVNRRLKLGHSPEDISNGIHGYDIQPHYIEQCRTRLQKLCPEQPFPNLIVGDFLKVEN